MKAEERRKGIINLLLSSEKPVSGGELASTFGVSRQIVVSDISILKASGYDILSTHSGYVIQKSPLEERVFKLYHTTSQTEDELNTIIDEGGTVVDVFVWHKVYGKLTANLNIYTHHHIKQFIEGVRTGKSSELMNITGGYHYHTVRANKKEILDRIFNKLNEKGYIAQGD
ncbi:MAG: transcription repressor NadR [Clostridia bacterium]|nr:transcription repressor NadR [Clostridia bacterium]